MFRLEIDPGAATCEHNEQCSSVWPGSTCKFGKCRCPSNQVVYETDDEPVCIRPGLHFSFMQ